MSIQERGIELRRADAPDLWWLWLGAVALIVGVSIALFGDDAARFWAPFVQPRVG